MSSDAGKTFEDIEYHNHLKELKARKKWEWRIRKKWKIAKHRKKLEIMVGYQFSNLGWIGAWFAADARLWGLFCLAVTLICGADVLILWKEYE